MNDIAEAFMGNISFDLAVNREVLKAAVMRQICCSRSGVVLDIRTAVYFRVETKAGKAAAEVVTGDVWDTISEKLTTVCAERDIALEVIDGRVVNARKARKAKKTN